MYNIMDTDTDNIMNTNMDNIMDTNIYTNILIWIICIIIWIIL